VLSGHCRRDCCHCGELETATLGVMSGFLVGSLASLGLPVGTPAVRGTVIRLSDTEHAHQGENDA
jgi:hypothetical protein